MIELPNEDRRVLVVIAGHNGAGKTTIYRERLRAALSPYLAAHINPDDIYLSIASDLDLGSDGHNREEVEQIAAREANRLRQKYLDEEVSFSFETVLSDPKQDKINFLKEARIRGYLVILFAVGLSSVELSKDRVAIRHAKGGHDVPAEKLESRYKRVLVNFQHGAHVATLAIFFDNSETRGPDEEDTYWDIAFFENGKLVAQDESPPEWWRQIAVDLVG